MDNVRGSGPFNNELDNGMSDNLADDLANDLNSPEYISYDEPADISYDEPEDVMMDAPPVIQGDERRLQVRAYNYWTEQLGDNNYPSIEELDPEDNEDFAPYGVLLDFTSGIENPSIAYVGDKLRTECALSDEVTYLDQVPARSLLSRITDHYLQIIANCAPIGFEAEFVNESGINIMYRGILLPYSSDDDTIDFIYGLINWKEGVAREMSDELQLEVSNALLDTSAQDGLAPIDADQIWAEAPKSGLIEASSNKDELLDSKDMNISDDATIDSIAEHEPTANDSLADWLHAARNSADNAKHADARSRETLYQAISRAYDFALVAEENTDDYQMILEDSGIKAQERAPMTPIVKLIFGSNYDKTRITEIASAMSFAKRSQVTMGAMSKMLSDYDGGLKAMVKAERLAKKIDKGEQDIAIPVDPRDALREAPARSIDEFSSDDEFIVLMARRDENGELCLVGHVQADAAFHEKALRKTIV